MPRREGKRRRSREHADFDAFTSSCVRRDIPHYRPTARELMNCWLAPLGRLKSLASTSFACCVIPLVIPPLALGDETWPLNSTKPLQGLRTPGPELCSQWSAPGCSRCFRVSSKAGRASQLRRSGACRRLSSRGTAHFASKTDREGAPCWSPSRPRRRGFPVDISPSPRRLAPETPRLRLIHQKEPEQNHELPPRIRQCVALAGAPPLDPLDDDVDILPSARADTEVAVTELGTSKCKVRALCASV